MALGTEGRVESAKRGQRSAARGQKHELGTRSAVAGAVLKPSRRRPYMTGRLEWGRGIVEFHMDSSSRYHPRLTGRNRSDPRCRQGSLRGRGTLP